MPEAVHCISCKRQVDESLVKRELTTAFCDECQQAFRTNQEIKRPIGSENIRFRFRHNELEIKIYWRRNKYPGFNKLSNRNLFNALLARFLSYFIIQTTISVNSEIFTIQSNPEHLLPMTHYPVNYVKLLKVKKIPDEYLERTKIVRGHGLYAEAHSGSESLLLWNLDIPTLLYIEQEITRVLKHHNSLHN